MALFHRSIEIAFLSVIHANCSIMDLANVYGKKCKVDFVSNVNYIENGILRMNNLNVSSIGEFIPKVILDTVTILYLNGNRIQSTKGLEKCWKLEKLSMVDNQLDRFSSIESLGHLKSLRCLQLDKNEMTSYACYRYHVLYRIPQLKELDRKKYTKLDRKLCASIVKQDKVLFEKVVDNHLKILQLQRMVKWQQVHWKVKRKREYLSREKMDCTIKYWRYVYCDMENVKVKLKQMIGRTMKSLMKQPQAKLKKFIKAVHWTDQDFWDLTYTHVIGAQENAIAKLYDCCTLDLGNKENCIPIRKPNMNEQQVNFALCRGGDFSNMTLQEAIHKFQYRGYEPQQNAMSKSFRKPKLKQEIQRKTRSVSPTRKPMVEKESSPVDSKQEAIHGIQATNDSFSKRLEQVQQWNEQHAANAQQQIVALTQQVALLTNQCLSHDAKPHHVTRTTNKNFVPNHHQAPMSNTKVQNPHKSQTHRNTNKLYSTESQKKCSSETTTIHNHSKTSPKFYQKFMSSLILRQWKHRTFGRRNLARFSRRRKSRYRNYMLAKTFLHLKLYSETKRSLDSLQTTNRRRCLLPCFRAWCCFADILPIAPIQECPIPIAPQTLLHPITKDHFLKHHSILRNIFRTWRTLRRRVHLNERIKKNRMKATFNQWAIVLRVAAIRHYRTNERLIAINTRLQSTLIKKTIWNAWLPWSKDRKRMRIRKWKAIDFALRKLHITYYDAWKSHYLLKRDDRARHQKIICMTYWNKWRAAFHQLLLHNKSLHVAISFFSILQYRRDTKVAVNVFRHWSEYVLRKHFKRLQRMYSQKGVVSITQHRNGSQVQICWAAWKHRCMISCRAAKFASEKHAAIMAAELTSTKEKLDQVENEYQTLSNCAEQAEIQKIETVVQCEALQSQLSQLQVSEHTILEENKSLQKKLESAKTEINDMYVANKNSQIEHDRKVDGLVATAEELRQKHAEVVEKYSTREIQIQKSLIHFRTLSEKQRQLVVNTELAQKENSNTIKMLSNKVRESEESTKANTVQHRAAIRDLDKNNADLKFELEKVNHQVINLKALVDEKSKIISQLRYEAEMVKDQGISLKAVQKSPISVGEPESLSDVYKTPSISSHELHGKIMDMQHRLLGKLQVKTRRTKRVVRKRTKQ